MVIKNTLVIFLFIALSGCGKTVENGPLPGFPPDTPEDEDFTAPKPTPALTPTPAYPQPPAGRPPGKPKCFYERQVTLRFTQPDPIVTAISLEPGDLTMIQDVFVDHSAVLFRFDTERGVIQLHPEQAGKPGSQVAVTGCN